MEQVRRGMDEYPLAAALGFAALGALVGLVLPHTRREDELMGERSEHLIGAAKEKGKDLIDRGKTVVERAAQTALSEAQNQGITPESASSALSGLAAKAGDILTKVKEEAASAAEEEGLTPGRLKERVMPSSGESAPAGREQSPAAQQQRESAAKDCGCAESGGVDVSATMPSKASATVPTGPSTAAG